MRDNLQQRPEGNNFRIAGAAPGGNSANEPAATVPYSPGSEISPQQWQFLSRVAPGAIESERGFTIPACVTAAQAVLESATSAGWGTSALFQLADNPFGIKYEHFAEPNSGGSSHDSDSAPAGYGHFDAETWEIVNGRKQESLAQFQRFPNLTAAFLAHAQLLCSARYRAAFAARSDWRQFAERLGPKTSPQDDLHCGYSTNPEYGRTLIRIIEGYHLDDPRVLARLAAGTSEPAGEDIRADAPASAYASPLAHST